MRFHILGLVHVPTNRGYQACAFTQKVHKLCTMLKSLGHTVFFYGAEGSEVDCDECIVTHSLQNIKDTWGDHPPTDDDIGYDWRKVNFRHDFNGPYTALYHNFNMVAASEINKRKKPDDFLLLTMGVYQKPIADAVDLFLTCEPGIGYRGSFCKYRAFESAYLMNFTYGSEHPGQSINGNFYDRVIPNYFEARDFTFQGIPSDYYLFVGRVIQRKGVEIASQVAKHLGKKLIVAGQGGTWNDNTKTLAGEDCAIQGSHIEYVGTVGAEERNKLMGGALVSFAPTLYLEAFGGVHIEAALCGTPVLTTNFGVYPGTVIDGMTGFRCDTLNDFIENTKLAEELDRSAIRKHAERYLTTNVQYEFDKWFEDLHRVWESATIPGKEKQGWNWIASPPAVLDEGEEWKNAQEWEQWWWRTHTGSMQNTTDEDIKQIHMLEKMKIPRAEGYSGYWFDAQNKNVLDIGANGVSALLKCKNLGESCVVVDPLVIPGWCEERYEQAGIYYLQESAEELTIEEIDALMPVIDIGFEFDEVWIYNVLQHTQDPEEIVKRARKLGKVIRLFEWVETGITAGHIHNLTEEDLDRWLGGKGTVEKLIPDRSLLVRSNMNGLCYYGVFENE